MAKVKKANVIKIKYCKPILLYYKNGELYIDNDYYYVNIQEIK